MNRMDVLGAASAQELSDMIGAIYDCALDPDLWQGTVRRIAEMSDSVAGSMCVHDIGSIQNSRLFDFGYTPEFNRLHDQHIAESPFMAGAALAKVGDVATLATVCGDKELLESRFYRTVMQPHGYFDFIGLLALRTGNRIAAFNANRNIDAPRYGDRDVGLFRLLAPHICRTLAISDALDIRTLRSEMLETTLNGLVTGVYLVARDGRVVYMNAAAERQVKTGNALRILNHRLCPTDARARAELARTIDEIAKDEAETGQGGHSLAIPDAGGTGYVATLLPLDRGKRQSVLAPFTASVAVFAQDPAEVPLMPGEAFGRLYGLTGAELRVLLTLAQGLGGKEAADMLGVSEATVRTHLQRLFSKTGMSRQADLLRLFQNSAPPATAA